MTRQERVVLDAIQGSPSEMFFPFGAIIANCGLTRIEVRDACRSLRAQGLAEFSNGLWSEDGRPVGSGYAISPAGQLLVEEGEP